MRALATVGAALLLLTACAQPDPATSRVPDGDPQRGRELVVQYGCASCHALPDVPSVENGVGPDLHDLENRRYIAGQVPNRPEELVRWIRNPQAVVPGTAMPDVGVTEEDARDIAAYLYDQ